MNELITVLIRQVALTYGTYLVSTNRLDESLLEPMIGLALAGGSVGWMIWDRFIYPKIRMMVVVKDQDDAITTVKEIVSIKPTVTPNENIVITSTSVTETNVVPSTENSSTKTVISA